MAKRQTKQNKTLDAEGKDFRVALVILPSPSSAGRPLEMRKISFQPWGLEDY